MNNKKITFPIADRWSYLWLVIGALLSLVSNGRWIIPLAGWLAPVFLLRFMRTQKTWRGFLLIGLALFVMVAVSFYGTMFWLPLPFYLGIMAVNTFLIGVLPYLADRLLARRIPGFASTLVFPLAATALEFLSISASPTGTIGATAYTQYGNLPLMQLAAVTGMWGISFLMSWLASVTNWAWERQHNWRQIRRGVAIYAGVLLLVLLFGSARLALATPPTETVRMHGITEVDMRQENTALVQQMQTDWQAFSESSARFQELYLARTVEEARQGAQLVHWPELALSVPQENEPGLLQAGQEIARQEGIYLLMAYAVSYQSDRPFQNKLVMIDPAGEIVIEHLKYGGASVEGFEAGDGVLRAAETPFGTVTAIICADTNFPPLVRQAGLLGADILFSPSLEVRAVDPLHAYIAAFRAVENGVTVVRQADNGLSVVIDPYGRILSAVDHFQSGSRTMVAQVPARAGVFTLYPVIGDLFAWLTVAGFAATIVWALIAWRRERPPLPAQPNIRPTF